MVSRESPRLGPSRLSSYPVEPLLDSTAEDRHLPFDPSRRNLCRQSVVLAGGAVAAGLLLNNRAFAQSQKAPQSAVQYQDHPKGQDECDRCTHFIPGKTNSADGTCQVVQG